MVNSTVLHYLKRKKQDVNCNENLMHFSLKIQHTCEKSNYRGFPVSARDDELFQTPNQAHIPEFSNKHKNKDTSTNTAHCVKH
jgi:hypothetical protein